MTFSTLRTQCTSLRLSFAALLAPFAVGILIPSVGAVEHEHASHSHKGVISFDVYADGEAVHLLSAARAGDTVDVQYQRIEDGMRRWTKTVSVAGTLPPPANARRGNDIQIAAASDRLFAVWQQAGTGFRGSGPMATALSADGGKSWKPGPNPADDGSTSGHGFIDAAFDAQGTLHLVWLDSRSGRQGLRYAQSTDGGATWSKNSTLDDETCECCWNTLAVAPGGRIAVLYRDKNPRDMACVCSQDGGRTWSQSATVGKFNWSIDGCPHAGGGLAFLPTQNSFALHGVVWTGAEALAGAYHLASLDGSEWSPPRPFGESRPSSPDLAVHDDTLAIAWQEFVNDESAVVASLSLDGGATWTKPCRLSHKGVSARNPRIVSTAAGFCVFWSAAGEGHANTWSWRRFELP